VIFHIKPPERDLVLDLSILNYEAVSEIVSLRRPSAPAERDPPLCCLCSKVRKREKERKVKERKVKERKVKERKVKERKVK
jgi:hypothetical protein